MRDATDDFHAADGGVNGERVRNHLDPSTRHPADALRLVRVEYTDAPDRWTIHPRNASRTVLVTTWLTADRDAFVDLAALR